MRHPPVPSPSILALLLALAVGAPAHAADAGVDETAHTAAAVKAVICRTPVLGRLARDGRGGPRSDGPRRTHRRRTSNRARLDRDP